MPEPTTDSPPTFDELKARILSGDETVSPEDLARAAELDQWAKLQEQAAAVMAAEKAAQEKHDRIRAAAEHALAVFDDDDTQLADAMIREGIRRRVEHYKRQAQAFSDATGAFAREGIRKNSEPVSGCEWREATMGMPERLIIDGRDIAPRIPHREIADAIDAGLADAGERRHLLVPHVQINPRARARVETDAHRQHLEELRRRVLAEMAAEDAKKAGS